VIVYLYRFRFRVIRAYFTKFNSIGGKLTFMLRLKQGNTEPSAHFSINFMLILTLFNNNGRGTRRERSSRPNKRKSTNHPSRNLDSAMSFTRASKKTHFPSRKSHPNNLGRA
jgi:hypothetical protein